MGKASLIPGGLGALVLVLLGGAFGAIEGPSSMVRGGDPEDSLQNLVQQEPENPSHWVGLGQLALKTNQDDLAKGYFDEAIKLSKSSADPILRIGLLWLENGKLETALPYLMPNLSLMDAAGLTRLAKVLEDKKHPSAAILVLRHHASRGTGFVPELRRAADLAFRSEQYALCRDILTPHAAVLDTASARLLLLAGFYAGKPMDSQVIQLAGARSSALEVKTLAALDQSMAGNFAAAKAWLDAPGSLPPAPVRSYIEAQELAAADKTEEAIGHFEQAISSTWPEFRVIATAELYRHFSLTGNSYKADQVWDDIKERDTSSALKEFLATQLSLRSYDKQARILYKSVFRSNPGRPLVLKALWDELAEDRADDLGEQVKALMGVDPLNCEANQLAMRFNKARNQNREVVRHGRNVVLYCSEVVEPYFDLATALMSLSKPEEARIYFGKFVKNGGDKTRIPNYMR